MTEKHFETLKRETRNELDLLTVFQKWSTAFLVSLTFY